ncbi:hybrid sensor histidine kinase/response regulator [Flavobacterium pallidum]|uniref:histidine kinase n=1 Tax=Flavobacterium pallidum TaxID=2172098 RepID=A0A2S1SI94_9FLAO|nr:response regulator [Flavobacterium pallidum]AWI26101.1 hybrid sensor histidine kinase/response regulator [Flavobacterium pallidum]
MILIVDDKRENIIPLKKILELHQLESDSADSGEEALKKTLKKDYSLIILDVQMPGMDGFEVAEALSGSNRTKDIPIIFLSAINKEKKYISKGYHTGGVDYVTKPVDADLLILKVKTFLKLYQQQQELKGLHNLLSKEIEIRKEAQENLEEKVLERTRELQAKNDELEFRNHELQQFAWVVSHDLKEPIRKIEIFVRLIKDRYLIDEAKAHETIERALASSARMTKLIEDLLDYSRLSSSAVPEKTDLNEVVGEVLSDLEYLIEQKGGTIIIENTLPTIDAIQSQLRQVMQNLIGNSLKFSKPDVPPVITITSECVTEKECTSRMNENGNFYRISVKDNGIGFDENYVGKIFTIFQRLHHRDAYEGTGIGLAIAKKIIEKHNGLITARSTEGSGAEFIIILPK